ncbi:MAG: ComEA family DNA-binding protein [Chloroflexi bacterium]|nr:ComEA family DNA-binding protein [Chloroflexota bacterium]
MEESDKRNPFLPKGEIKVKTTRGIIISVMCSFLVAGLLFLVIGSQRGEAITLLPAPTPAPISVHVTGAVASPGLYELPNDSRVLAAIEAAGGFLDEADQESLNLAAFLQDGSRLEVPFVAAEQSNPIQTVTSAPPTQPTSTFPININTASQAELILLDGIGLVRAQNIIDYRQENGPFERIEDIQNVPDIGPVTFNNIKGLITVE